MKANSAKFSWVGVRTELVKSSLQWPLCNTEHRDIFNLYSFPCPGAGFLGSPHRGLQPWYLGGKYQHNLCQGDGRVWVRCSLQWGGCVRGWIYHLKLLICRWRPWYREGAGGQTLGTSWLWNAGRTATTQWRTRTASSDFYDTFYWVLGIGCRLFKIVWTN